MTDARQRSPAAARNTGPILKVLKSHLPATGRVLEIACGSGEHALAAASAFAGIEWTPSDPNVDAIASVEAWRTDGPENLMAPVRLDAMDEATWPEGPFKALFCANMVHISSWTATEGLMRLASRVLVNPGGLLALYGPYRESDRVLADSNAAFDADLKARDPDWGLRDRDVVVAEAMKNGLAHTLRVAMPANNLMLLFRRA